jgi:hypothetical protein
MSIKGPSEDLAGQPLCRLTRGRAALYRGETLAHTAIVQLL